MTREVRADPATGTGSPVRVRLLHVPDCPLTGRVRIALREAIRSARIPVVVEDHVGQYPSPTLLVGDTDVLTGQPLGHDPCCRLELPTADQIASALRRESHLPGTTDHSTTEASQ